MAESTNYELLLSQLDLLIAEESDRLANCANFVALLFSNLADVNWLGIYVARGEELVLGPYQGLPACTRIVVGQGVCGAAAKQLSSIVVTDVNQFPGHIACDSRSRSEIVVPLMSRGKLIGVLDVDSPKIDRFNAIDKHGLERMCESLVHSMERESEDLDNFI